MRRGTYCLRVSTSCSDFGTVVIEQERHKAEEDGNRSEDGGRHLWPKIGIVGLANDDESSRHKLSCKRLASDPVNKNDQRLRMLAVLEEVPYALLA